VLKQSRQQLKGKKFSCTLFGPPICCGKLYQLYFSKSSGKTVKNLRKSRSFPIMSRI
jgi:hypothetical protein